MFWLTLFVWFALFSFFVFCQHSKNMGLKKEFQLRKCLHRLACRTFSWLVIDVGGANTESNPTPGKMVEQAMDSKPVKRCPSTIAASIPDHMTLPWLSSMTDSDKETQVAINPFPTPSCVGYGVHYSNRKHTKTHGLAKSKFDSYCLILFLLLA